MKKICLCMIVKNEEHVIKRSLESVKGFIDYWIVVDTGSTDNTKGVISEVMQGVPGEIHDIPWKNFAFNRGESLRLAKDKGDYSLVMDADEFVVFNEGFDKDKFKESLDLDIYDVHFRNGGITYVRTVLTKNSLGWSYRGAVHEFPFSEIPAVTRANADGFYQSTFSDGARSRDPQKYEKDAEAIKMAMEEDGDEFMQKRYTFYLAQCYKDAGKYELAYERYMQRSKMGGWVEEVFVSLHKAGELAIYLNKPEEVVLARFSEAFEAAPWRAESIYSAVNYMRLKNQFGIAYLLAKSVLDIPNPGTKSLFVIPSTYDYALLDEFALCAYYTHKYEESHSACVQLLSSGKLPLGQVARIKENMRHCLGKF